MPRPKVDPSKRQRAVEACLPCQASKKRCTGTIPCTNCVRKGQAQNCTLSRQNASRGDASNNSHNRSHDSRRNSKTSNRESGPIDANQTMTPADSNGNTQSSSSIAEPLSPDAAHRMQPRMLQGSQGEKVFIGGSASLSFLQFIRDSVCQSIGPSQFTHDVRSGMMFEDTTYQQPLSPSLDDVLADNQRLQLVDIYFMAVGGYIEILSRTEAERLVQDQRTSSFEPKSNYKQALSDLILAIGAQCSKPDPILEKVEKFYFTRGRQMAFANMLQNPNIDMVATFLLMSFYMLGACHRNAAFMYLGVATRAAVVLGFHCEESYLSASNMERQKQLQVWVSLRVMDLLVSSILARPSASSGLAMGVPNRYINASQELDVNGSLIISHYRLALIIERIVDKVYGQTAVSAKSAEDLLDQLKDWSNTLPESLLNQSFLTSTQNTEKALSNLHVACTYYFAVTLVTRPFLISTLTARVTKASRGVPEGFEVPEHPDHSRLATVCVDSAVWMIRTCLEANKDELLLPNMCIMKALVFAAALILGFSLFAQLEVDLETEAMFAGARDILQMFAQRSHQAEYYFEILTSLTQTITRQRQQMALRSRGRNNPFSNPLFKISLNETTFSEEQLPGRDLDQASEISGIYHGSGQKGAQQNVIGGTNSTSEDTASSNTLDHFSDLDVWMQNQQLLNRSRPQENEFGEDLSGWDSLDLSLWDSFPFMNQPPA